MQTLTSKLILLSILLFISACSSYKTVVDSSINQLKNNYLEEKTLKKLEVGKSSKEYLLYSQELSRIYFITDNVDNSLIYSKKSTDYYNQLDDNAVVNAGGVASGLLSSSFGNDNNLTYKGSDYERAFEYFYSSLSYLRKNNLDSAMIDIRAASDIQKLSTVKREKRIMKAQEEINSKKNYSLGKDAQSILAENNKILSSTQNGFLNAYIYYLSGNIRELYGDINGAMVDYKLAFSVNPNNSYLQQDILRLAKSIDYSYYQDLSKSYKDKNDNYSKQATLIIVYEQGFVPKKEEIRGTILSTNGNFYTISLPSYGNNKTKPSLVSIDVFSQSKIKSEKLEVIANVYDMAKNDLAEVYPMILARQATRVATKSIAQSAGRGISDDKPALGLLMYGAGAISAITEKADTRSFRTLPHFVEVAKLNSNENINKVKVVINLNKSVEFDNLAVNQGETAILYVVDTGNYVYKSIIYKSTKS
jgi:hypothetical protein